MSELPPNGPEKSEMLDYRSPQNGSPRGWLITAKVMAWLAGIYCVIIFLLLLDGTPMYALFLGGAAVVVVLAAIGSRRIGVSAALAIVVASACIGVLTFGTCAAAVLTGIGR